ncbi:Letm1 RBD domain-containing protein [Mycena indigotica]|uniref:Letm1 RBD domain-containing protein n=1 Tax=Mycena indigotica TaxID=2126181 RepID=A0A8H6WHP9_9AGAR|nr:Letm1 RBD domain-containing protein [Mycena indigotica]KAF7315318.1 Letm1 RBD domain-containing protein [Mycena indigotica]
MLARNFRVGQTCRIVCRQLQTLPTPPDTSSLPPPQPNRRSQVQLHPTPIKPPPKTTSATRSAGPVVQTKQPASLKTLKETTAKDISDAEAHGILTPPDPSAGWAKATLHKAIQLAKFYYRGVKLVYTRGQIVRQIHQRIDSGGAPLERWEHRLFHTQATDIRRVVPFVLTALIIEEVIPLIIIWAPGFLPSTCILPSQRERIQEQATSKALDLAIAHGAKLTTMTQSATGGTISLAALPEPTVICGVRFFRLLGLSTFGFNFMRRRRIHRHLTFVEKDDVFLSKDSIHHLSSQDLQQALRERGIIPRGLDTPQQIQKLTWWLKSVQEKSDAVARRIYLVALMASR